MRNFFLISLCLHLLLVVFVIFGKPNSPVSEPSAVFVELPPLDEEKISATKSNASKPKANTGSTKKNAAPNAQPQKLIHSENIRSLRPFAVSQNIGDANGNSYGNADSPFSFFNSMDLKQEGKFSPIAQKVLKQIDSYVGYPPDFIEENFAGDVVLHFLVSPEGKFLKFLHVDGDQRALTLYSMAMVIMALQREISQLPKERPQKSFPISLALSFRLLLPDEYSDRKDPRWFKNSLQLDRVAFTEPKAIKKARRIIQKNTPPLIPVPGGFFVDFVSLYKRFAESDSDDPDWERKARMQLDQETLELFLKTNS